MKTVTVYPTKASALNVKHPHGPRMALAGVIWPLDSFTARRLRDDSVTKIEAKGLEALEAAKATVATADQATTGTTTVA